MKLKICGVQSVADAQGLAELGVDFIGLNFVPTSTRCIDVKTAREIAEIVRSTNLRSVALFQDQPLDLVRQYIEKVGPDYVQLHGQETEEYIDALDTPVIQSLTEVADFLSKNARYYLLDRTTRGEGRVVDVATAHRFVDAYPHKIFLAGGLTPDNLAGILSEVQPFAVDIAGGVRAGDDAIDFDKVKRVLEIVRRQP